MQSEARVWVMVDVGGQRALTSVHGGDSGANRKRCTVLHSQQQQQHFNSGPQLDAIHHMLAGGIAGAFSKTCTAPLALLTILFQVKGMHTDIAALRKASMWREVSRILYEERLSAFWKGNLVTIAHRLAYSSISFYAYEQYKHMLQLVRKSMKPIDIVIQVVFIKLSCINDIPIGPC